MTRSPEQETPVQLHGVGTESDHEWRTPVGSDSTAAFRARSERPSELRVEMNGREI